MACEIRSVGRRVLTCLPPVDFAFSYGSAVLPQVDKSGATRKGAMMDFILAVRDPVAWHEANLAQHPRHYSALGRVGSRAVECAQRRGAGVYFNPLVSVTEPGGLGNGQDPLPAVKYGVVAIDDLAKDLTCWNHLYAAGRLHKPVNVLTPGITTAFSVDTSFQMHDDAPPPSEAALSLLPPLQSNLRSALSAVLLSLPPVFSDKSLWNALTELSYRGDIRMLLRAEAPEKSSAIARGSRSALQTLYAPYLAEAGIVAVRAEHVQVEEVEALSFAPGAADKAAADATLLEYAMDIAAATVGRSPEETIALAFSLDTVSSPSNPAAISGASSASTVPDGVLLCQPTSPSATATLISFLPPQFAAIARAAAATEAETGAGAGAVRAAAGAAVSGECARVVLGSSMSQLVKGLVSAGVGRSITYSAAKLAKGLKNKAA